jgi:hypothetical protein
MEGYDGLETPDLATMTNQELCHRLEKYDFYCKGGPLRNCLHWKELCRRVGAHEAALIPDEDRAKIAPAPPLLTAVLEALYESEINATVCISSFWDDGWKWNIKLGDSMNGFKAEKNFHPDELQCAGAAWLVEEAIKQYPRSEFAKRFGEPRPSEGQKQLARSS